MYSPTVFGWPDTSIRPSRTMSRPTEIMFVASTTSTGSLRSKVLPSRALVSATSAVPIREVNSSASRKVRSAKRLLADPLPRAVARCAQSHLVIDYAAGTAQLAQGVEVRHDRHIGIGRIDLRRAVRLAASCLLPCLDRSSSKRRRRTQKQHLRAPPRRGQTEVETRPVRSLIGLGKKRVGAARPGRREDRGLRAVEERLYLALRPPHLRRRGDQLWADRLALHRRRAERFECGLIEPRHRA